MKPRDHQRITRRAIEIFTAWRNDSFSRLLLQHQEEIVEGSKDADTRPLHVRSTNWHFYKANDALRPIETHLLWVPITVYPTSDHILRLRIEALRKECAKGVSDDLFNLVGRILHHTQDMSTPAHVVPVYHGMDILNLVPDALNVRDSFEEYSERHSVSELATLNIGAEDFAALTTDPPHLLDNYNQAAQRTLHLLFNEPAMRFTAHVNGQLQQLDWSIFWQPWDAQLEDEASRHGFGQYGPLGPHFGETEVNCNGTHYQLAREIQVALHRKLLGKMLADSARALARVQCMLD
ncbi:MAG: hypothetical protein D6678_06165 [Zetaproteobacteria bacterium]|nr:MAG: hypothetical protein D6678_06165 [Zetaproteobacteria bacterium]